MRILIVTNDMHPRTGGPPHVVAGHALVLKRRGHDPELIATVGADDEEAVRAAWKDLQEAGIPLHLFHRSAPGMIGRSVSFNRFIDERIGSFDVMHIHGIWEHCLAYAGQAAHAEGVPYVLEPHGMLDRWSRARSSAKKAIASRLLGTRSLMRHADGAQFGTDEERDEAADLGMPWRPFLVPNGLDAERFVRLAGEGCEPLFEEFPQLRGRLPLLLFYSRMHPKKGIDLLLEAMARLAGDHPDAGLLVAAIRQDASYEAKIRERAQRDDLCERVAVTTSYQGDRAKIPINAADVFVLPSYQEGFSMAIVEAMAYALPLVITDTCHMDVVREIGAGEVTPVTVEGVEAGLRKVIEASEDDRRAMGERGREWVLANCTWDCIGEKLESMYRELRSAKGYAS